jgi:hypothetical protein
VTGRIIVVKSRTDDIGMNNSERDFTKRASVLSKSIILFILLVQALRIPKLLKDAKR